MQLAISAVDIMLYNTRSFPKRFQIGCFEPLHKDAYPGEGIELDVSKFESLVDGCAIAKNSKGELFLCNHSTAQSAVPNGDGTHNMICGCGNIIITENVACSGGEDTSTCMHGKLCDFCGVKYDTTKAPDNHENEEEFTYTANEGGTTHTKKYKCFDAVASEADATLKQAIEKVASDLESAKKELQDDIDANETDIEDKVKKLDEAYKAALDENDAQLQTFIIIVCVMSSVTLCGSGAFVIWFFVDRKNRV